MRALGKIGLVIAGYISAILVAALSTWAYIKLTDTPERELSAGMYGFGDSLVFLAVFGLAAVPATSLALFFLRQNRWFWRICSTIAATLAATGLVSIIAYVAGRTAPNSTWIGSLATFSPLRLLAAPLFGGADFLSGIFAPERPLRVRFFVCTLIEGAIFGIFLAVMVLIYR